MYDINLRATHTMILSIRGVTIPIYLVSSATDSIRQCVVLFKSVPVLASDPKSEFLCQSSLSCAEPTDPLNTLYAWDISHALVTTYHPYCHSPSTLTEYLKQKLRHQRAKHLGRSPSAQVEQNIPLERNMRKGEGAQGGGQGVSPSSAAQGCAHPPCPSYCHPATPVACNHGEMVTQQREGGVSTTMLVPRTRPLCTPPFACHLVHAVLHAGRHARGT